MRRMLSAAVTTALLFACAPVVAQAVEIDPWQFAFLNAVEAHPISQGEGVTLAIIDSGEDESRPTANVPPLVKSPSRNPDNGTRSLQDQTSGGTGSGLAWPAVFTVLGVLLLVPLMFLLRLRYGPSMSTISSRVATADPGPMRAEWCIVATLLPYPYRGNRSEQRSHGIFPAGAKLYVIGGFAGMGHETVTVVGYAHGRRSPVLAHLPHKYLGGWRVALVYSPSVLRRIHSGETEDHRVCHRFRRRRRDAADDSEVISPEYRDHLAQLASTFQQASTQANP